MALDQFIAGPYVGLYSALHVGVTRDGFNLETQTFAENIDETDIGGQSLLDWVYRGSNWTIEFNSKTYKVGSVNAYYPWASLGAISTLAGPISRLASNVAQPFVLTATPNTPAAATPATLTAPLAILQPGQSLKLLYSSKVREVPVRLALLPTTGNGGLLSFVLT